MPDFAVILPAAGKSTRFGGRQKKPFVELEGQPLWLRTANLFRHRPDVCGVWLVVDAQDREWVEQRHGPTLHFLGIRLVNGGAERFESVANALAVLPAEAAYVAVHDAVRPLTSPALIEAVFERTRQTGAALAAVPVADTLKRSDDGQLVTQTISRQGLWLAQTPQAARRDWLVAAYAQRQQSQQAITDDAQLLEAAGYPVALVPGEPSNFKITTQQDLALAQAVLNARQPTQQPSKMLHPFADDDLAS
jgi:2-C-methyl-D-erythritol 4-phosphate cytidylyltransferase